MIYAIKIVLRTMLKSRVYTVISVLGLTLGLAACMLIASVVVDELSYDKHWAHSSDIYRLVSVDAGAGIERKNGGAYAGLAPLLKENFDEIEEYSTLYVTPVDLLLDKEDSQSVKLTALYTDSAVHHLLDVRLLEEDNLTPSPDINKIVISQKIANTYFKDVDAVGKIIYDLPRYQDKSNEYLIVGIMEDLPVNTHLRADVIMLQHRAVRELRKDGGGMYVRHYLLVKPGTDPRLLERDISQWYANYVTEAKFAIGSYELQSIEDS